MKKVTADISCEKPTRQILMDAAQELLKEQGYKHMTVDGVAARANLGKGTIYLYFASKEELALSIIDRMNLLLQDQMRSIARGKDTPEQKLEKLLKERVLVRLQAVEGHKTGIDDLLFGLRAQLFERRDRYHQAEALLLAEVLIEGRTLGVFDVDEPHETAYALLTATNALLPYSLSPKELVERVQVQKSIERLAPMLVKSVRKAPVTG